MVHLSAHDVRIARMVRRRRRQSVRGRAATVGVVLVCLLALAPGTAFAAVTSAPTEPGTIIVSNLTPTSVSISWANSHPVSRIEGYRVYRGLAPGTPMSLIATTDATPSYTASHLRSGQTY